MDHLVVLVGIRIGILAMLQSIPLMFLSRAAAIFFVAASPRQKPLCCKLSVSSTYNTLLIAASLYHYPTCLENDHIENNQQKTNANSPRQKLYQIRTTVVQLQKLAKNSYSQDVVSTVSKPGPNYLSFPVYCCYCCY